MDDLKTGVEQAFMTMLESGKIQEIVEKQLDSTVASMIKDILSPYGPFGKGLKEYVESSLQVDFRQLNLAGYNETVLKIIKTKMDAAIRTAGMERIEKEMTSLLAAPPKEMKLSELVEQYKRRVRDRDGNSRITCIVDLKDNTGLCPGYAHIYLDKEKNKSRYSCEIQLDVTPQGEVFGLKLSGTDIKNTLFVGPLWDFERSLFQMYASGTKIIIDADDVDDYFNSEGDD